MMAILTKCRAKTELTYAIKPLAKRSQPANDVGSIVSTLSKVLFVEQIQSNVGMPIFSLYISAASLV